MSEREKPRIGDRFIGCYNHKEYVVVGVKPNVVVLRGPNGARFYVLHEVLRVNYEPTHETRTGALLV